MKTRIGNVIEVTNKKKKNAANEQYFSVIVKFNGVDSSLLFTQNEISTAFDRARKNKEDNVQRSLLSFLLD